MGYVEILTPDQLDTADYNVGGDAVLVGCSPDQISTARDLHFTDWLCGYALERRETAAQHDGHAATLIELSDSQGERPVGRLVLRNDALRDARLEVVRIFGNREARDAFVREQSEGTDEVKTIQLDVTDEGSDSILAALMDMTEGTEITYRVVNPHGPGGGWPVVAFTGKDRELRRMLRQKYGADGVHSESVAFYMGEED